MNATPRSFWNLSLTNRFPRIWVPTPAERDLRQLLWHRHKLVRMRTMLGNQLHFLAMSQGLCRKQKLFNKKGRGELARLRLAPWASRRREELLKLLDQLDPAIAELDRAVLEEAQRREDAVLLMTHPGIGPNTALAFVLAIGPVSRFQRSKKIASYLGLNPSEESSGGRRRLGAISKQGSTMVRWAADRNCTSSCAPGSRITAGLPAVEIPQRTRGGQGRHRTEISGAYVLDAAQWSSLRTAGSQARQPGATLVNASSSLG